MGRIAGVTAQETREKLLAAAARVFARTGYDGARIAEIAAEAGLSGGAIYSHFPTKAELFAAAFKEHGLRAAERLLAVGDRGAEVITLALDRGLAMAHRHPEEGALLVEAFAAARRHPDVAELLVGTLVEGERRFAGMLRAGQDEGAVDGRVLPDAVSRFTTLLGLGSLLAAAVDLPAVDEDEWAALMSDLVGRFHARPPA